MQPSRALASCGECSTSARCLPGLVGRAQLAVPQLRRPRVTAAAVSGADDRSGDQTYQRASTVPDSLPVAGEGSDWREFRARLVASTRAAAAAPAAPADAPPAVSVEPPAAAAAAAVPPSAPSSKCGGSSSSSSATIIGGSTERSAFNQLEWAHELSRPEPGCLLLAHPYMFRERQRYFYQAVILLLDHGPEGSYGIILNRPTQYKVSQIKSTVHELLALFKDNRLYMGGDCGDTAMVVLTPRSDIQGVTEVTQGIYHHNVHGAGAAVAAGIAKPEDFRFFAQYAGWAPGQLEEECKSGVWFCTAASPALTLDSELSSGGAMWHAVLQVMGGDHARVSDIISEVEQRDLRAATERLSASGAVGSSSAAASPASDGDSDANDGDEEECDVHDACSPYDSSSSSSSSSLLADSSGSSSGGGGNAGEQPHPRFIRGSSAIEEV